MRVNVAEFMMEWIAPLVGAMLTAILVRSIGPQSGWWILLALPGALIFQWTVAFTLLGIASLTVRRPPPSDK